MEAAGVILWVDDNGDCGGETPCYATIQAAIDEAGTGQIVRVLPGERLEHLVVRTKTLDDQTAESNRIMIEADPASPVGSVLLGGRDDRCERGYAVEFTSSRLVTLRGFTIAGANKRGVVLRGSSKSIYFERNRLLRDRRLLRGHAYECQGGIDVRRGNLNTVIANNLVYGVTNMPCAFATPGTAARWWSGTPSSGTGGQGSTSRARRRR